MNLIELPEFEASWWPVMLETVPGSGERINIAVVVRTAKGEASVRQLIAPHLIRSMFGEAGKGMLLVVTQTVVSLQRQLDAGIKVEAVDAPFGGISLGHPRDCVARDLAEAFEVATHMSSAFAISEFGTKETPSYETRKAFDEWAEKVKAQALVQEDAIEISHAFNVTVPLTHRKRARIGFLRGSYAAHFGVLRPGKSAYADVRALKLKLFDLDMLKRNQMLDVQRAEVIIGCPDLLADSAFPKADAERLNDSWAFISEAARTHGIKPLRYNKAADAANHLRMQIAA